MCFLPGLCNAIKGWTEKLRRLTTWMADMDALKCCHVRLTMERLYHIIQFANASFFAGETAVAYEIYSDALALFTRLGNSKVGV